MERLELTPATTALVLIDLQNGTLARALAPHPRQVVVSNSLKLADSVRESGGTVVFVHVLFSEMISLPSDSPTRDPNAPPPPASASELAPEVSVHSGDLVIAKRQWGAFHGTSLDQQLRRRGVQTIILGGVATNFGVESTARAAFDQGYALVFAEDAMTSISAEAHEFATKSIFPRMGRVRTSAEILEALGG